MNPYHHLLYLLGFGLLVALVGAWFAKREQDAKAKKKAEPLGHHFKSARYLYTQIPKTVMRCTCGYETPAYESWKEAGLAMDQHLESRDG